MAATPYKIKSDVKIEGAISVPNESSQRATHIDASGRLTASTTTSTELGYLSGVTSSVQTQIASKANASDLTDHLNDAVDAHDASAISSIPSGNLAASDVQSALNELQSDVDTRLTASNVATLTNKTIDAEGTGNSISNIKDSNIKAGAAIDASKIADGSVSNAEFQYLDGVTSAIQTQLNGKQATITGAATSITSADLTASKALVSDASGKVAASSVSSTELSYVSGVTSSIQTQINSKISSSEKGANNGVATLDAGGKIPASQLPNSVMEYQGNHDVSTNSPALADGTGNAGDVYRVNVAGTRNYGSGSLTLAIGDWLVYNGSIWEKSINSDAVTSVNSQTGVVVLTTSHISEGSNLYFSDERAQDAVGNALVDSSSIDFTYNDAGNSITAAVLPSGVDHDSLANFVANKHIDHSAVSISTASLSGLSGGGDITSTRSLSIDASNLTAKSSASNADYVVIYDAAGSATKKMLRSDFMSGSGGGLYDISETSFSAANNVASPANVTGLAFSSANVRSAKVLASVYIDATSDLFECFELLIINKGSSFDMAVAGVGDSSGITFTIDNSGQVLYTSSNQSGFVSSVIKFRAICTSV